LRGPKGNFLKMAFPNQNAREIFRSSKNGEESDKPRWERQETAGASLIPAKGRRISFTTY